MSKPQIQLALALPTDFVTLSRLENEVFWTEEFSIVAFGPQRGSEFNTALRAASMAKSSPNQGTTNKFIKAVLTTDSGKEEVVGFAGWSFVTGRGKETDGKNVVSAEGENGGKEEKSEEETLKDNERIWGPGACFRFCYDAFCVADEHMMRSCEGKDYAKLSVLVVSPAYQRIGIGTQLLSAGLKEVDALGLQAVLGASPDGEGLYKKYGFTEFEVMNLKLWEYEGGEGMGMARHVIMHRSAQTEI